MAESSSSKSTDRDAPAGDTRSRGDERSGFLGRHLLVVVRVAVVFAILAAGVLALMMLGRLKPAPQVRPPSALLRNVRVLTVEPGEVQLTIQGYGTARAARTSHISAQVSGKIVAVSELLDEGELVDADQILVEIEPHDYKAALRRTEAEMERLEAEISRLRQDHEYDKERVETARVDRDLARKEYDRVQRLFEQQDIGAEREVDQARQVLSQKETALITARSALETFDARLEMVQAQLRRAQADAELAGRNLERCTVSAPFSGRITAAPVEIGQFVNVGQALFSVADNSRIEIPVTLASGRVARALSLSPANGDEQLHWFAKPDGIPVEIVWTEQPEQSVWNGEIVRVEKFDESTRTLVLVAVPGTAVVASAREFPLVAGMFCSAEIRGRTLADAVVIPREALQFSGDVFVVDGEDRIHARSVVVSHSIGNDVVIQEGLQQGDRVVLERLPRAFDGMQVRVLDKSGGDQQP